MIKKLLLILILPIICIAQEKKQSDSSIELPEFVITGVEKISLPTMSKQKAGLVSVLSEDYIKPTYSPEELIIPEISNPLRKQVILHDSVLQYNGRVQLGAGVQTIPIAELSYGSAFTNGIFWGRVWGKSEREYVDNAGVKNLGVDLTTSFFINNNSDFLPGAKIQVGGNYELESFSFYNPNFLYFKRNSQYGNLNLGISNLINENFKFDVKLKDNILSIKDRNLDENVLSLNGFLQTGFKGISIASVITLKHQNVKYDSLSSNNNTYFYVNPFAIINISDLIKIHGGVTYSHCGDKNFFSVYGYGAIKFSEELSFFGELNPKTEFLSLSDLSRINRYFNPTHERNIILKEKMNIKAALRYEYQKYFEIDAGMSFTDYDNYIYFSDDVQPGIFSLKTKKAKKVSGFVNFLFHTGPSGLFYGDLILENIKDYDNFFIPYCPSLKSNLSYGYQLSPEFRLDGKFYFASFSYTNVNNSGKVKEYIDLGIRGEYEFKSNLRLYSEISNLLNHKNYNWIGYKEKPFDIVFGIDYRW